MDRLDAMAATFDHAATIVAGVRSDQLSDPTPCEEWDVQTLLGHLTGVVVNCGRGAAGAALLPGAISVPMAEDREAKFRVEADRTLAAWRACDLNGMVDIGAGPMPAAMALGVNLVDTTTHTWDVARATGQQLDLSADHAAVVLEASREVVKDDLRSVVGFNPPVDVADAAGPVDELVAFLGREPSSAAERDMRRRSAENGQSANS